MMKKMLDKICFLLSDAGLVISPQAAILVWLVTVGGTFGTLWFVFTHRKTMPVDQRQTLYCLSLVLSCGTLIPLQTNVIYLVAFFFALLLVVLVRNQIGVNKKYSNAGS